MQPFEYQRPWNPLYLPFDELSISSLRFLEPRHFDLGISRSIQVGNERAQDGSLLFGVKFVDFSFNFTKRSAHVQITCYH